jgi:hypothetical protein
MRGTPAAYAALAQKDIDTLYFIAEPTATEGCLYLGNKLIAGNGTPGMGGDLSELLSLNDLSDVIVNTLDLADASFLIYDQKKQAWVNCSKEALYFVGSSSLSDGKAGLVPAPMQGEEHKFLRADGTWAAIPANTVDAMVYQVTANEGEEKEAAIVRIVNGAELHNGDIAIVKVLVAENVYEHTAYIYNGANWSAMDGNYSAENVYFKSDFVFTENVGTVKVPETGNIEVAAAGLNVAEFFNKLFSEVKEPVITPVEFTASLKDTLTYYEVGTTISPKYSTTFTPGSYEFGPETGVTVSAYSVVDTDGNKATAASGTMPAFTVADDTKYNIIVTATYGDGVKALNNLQKESDLYIEGNSISAATSFIRGYRSSFAGVDNGTGAIDSSVIRNLANAWNYNAGKILTIDAETIENPTRIIVAIPANSTRKGITEVIMPESMNFNCTADYVQQDNIMVDGAEGAAAAEYKVWVYAPSKMGADEVHKITMN